MPKSYTPNWFFTALLDNHINQMMARYSCLRALRMDFFYRKDTPDFLQPDHRWLELQLRMLLEQVEQFENIVGFFWVIEWTADHGFHAHVVFWIDRQRVKKIYPFAERIAECWQSTSYSIRQKETSTGNRFMHSALPFIDNCMNVLLRAITLPVHHRRWYYAGCGNNMEEQQFDACCCSARRVFVTREPVSQLMNNVRKWWIYCNIAGR